MLTVDKTIEVDERAVTVIEAMNERVASLARHFGEGSPQHTKAAASLARALARIFTAGFGGEKVSVSRDGDLSLYVVDGIHYGIIWFRDRAYDDVEGPQPGEWSMHS